MKKEFLRISFLLLLCLLQVFHTQAQPVPFHHFDVSDGLFNTQTRKVIEMPDGRILVQMEGMFSLFDGERFRSLEYDRTRQLPIESYLNTDYYFDHHHHLWVKSNNSLFAIDCATYTFLNPSVLLEGMGLAGRQVMNFFIVDSGEAVVENDRHEVYVYDWKSKARLLTRITTKNVEGKTERLTDAVSVNGQLALFFSNGQMVCYDKEGKVSARVTFISDYRAHQLKAASWGKTTLVVRDGEGLLCYDIKTGGRQRILEDGNVFAFRKYRRGDVVELCVSTNSRLYVFDQQLNIKRQFGEVCDEQTGELNKDSWQGMTLDRQGGIWATTFNNGLFYHSAVQSKVMYRKLADGENFITGVCLPKLGVDVSPLVEWPSITEIHTDKAGNLWLPTRNEGIVVKRAGSSGLERFHYSDVPGLWGTTSFVRQIDASAYLICTRLNRLAVFYPAERRLELLDERFPQLGHFRNMVTATEVEGGFLIGTQNGFFAFDKRRLQPDMERFRLLNENPYSDKCNCLFTDRDGTLWVGTQNGLFHLDERKGRLDRYSEKDGLPNSCVESIVADRGGNLWVATLRGICRMTMAEGKPQFLSVNTGTANNDFKFAERMAYSIGDSLFFATADGVYSFVGSDIGLPAMRLTPRLMTFTANDSVVAFSHDDDGQVAISLNYDETYVSMDVSALNYAFPHNTLYRYRIKKKSEVWTIVENGTGKLNLSFNSMEPGHYTIEMEASMQGQEWGAPLMVRLTVRPPWWQTWWAYTLYLLLFLAFVAAIVYAYVKHQRDRMAIEQQEARIRQLLEQIRMKSQVPDDVKMETNSEINVSAADEQFLQKAMEVIERHMDDAEYGVEAFSSDMAMDRTTLYRHLQSSVGRSPKEFIRTVRLKRAAELLRMGNHNVGEVADITGFPNRKSFAKYFRESFGVLPSEYGK